MNTFTAAAVTARLQALVLAFAVTLAMLGAIEGLATSEPPAALLASIAATQA